MSIRPAIAQSSFGRTQRLLPMKPGHAETGANEQRLNGVNCLPAAFDNIAEGIDPGYPVHAILDEVSSHRSNRQQFVHLGPLDQSRRANLKP